MYIYTTTHCNTLQHNMCIHTHVYIFIYMCIGMHSPTTRKHIKYAIYMTLQHTATHTATHCNILQHTATHCNTLQHTLQHTATHCNTLQHTATHCKTLQHTATHCNTLQHTATHTATHCNTLSNATLEHAVRDSSMCVTQLTDTWAISCLHDSRRQHCGSWQYIYMCIATNRNTYIYTWRDSLICETWLIGLTCVVTWLTFL